ncbi:MAG: glycosyltransferase family 2 protein [archaeon]
MVVELSVIMPVYNEQRNLEPLHKEITSVMKQMKISYEMVFVDDGSKDKSLLVLRKLHAADPEHVKILQFAKNAGQTAAWDAAIKYAQGKYFVMLDSDLQNDPKDIPMMLEKLKKNNLDVVSGWRYDRRDKRGKKNFSRMANNLRQNITKENIHDAGCSLKIYRRECFDNVDLYGENHRFITSIMALNGCKIGEAKVHHRARKFEETKYGAGRMSRGFLDFIMMLFLSKYGSRPIHVFGNMGLVSFIIGFFLALYLAVMRIFFAVPLADRPMLLLAILLIIIGIQFIIFGILAEILMRVYFKTHNMRPYTIKRIYE